MHCMGIAIALAGRLQIVERTCLPASRCRVVPKNSLHGMRQLFHIVGFRKPSEALLDRQFGSFSRRVTADHDGFLGREQPLDLLEDLQAVQLFVEKHVDDDQVKGTLARQGGTNKELTGETTAVQGFDLVGVDPVWWTPALRRKGVERVPHVQGSEEASSAHAPA